MTTRRQLLSFLLATIEIYNNTESFYSSVHNYLSLGITYSFDAK